ETVLIASPRASSCGLAAPSHHAREEGWIVQYLERCAVGIARAALDAPGDRRERAPGERALDARRELVPEDVAPLALPVPRLRFRPVTRAPGGTMRGDLREQLGDPAIRRRLGEEHGHGPRPGRPELEHRLELVLQAAGAVAVRLVHDEDVRDL